VADISGSREKLAERSSNLSHISLQGIFKQLTLIFPEILGSTRCMGDCMLSSKCYDHHR